MSETEREVTDRVSPSLSGGTDAGARSIYCCGCAGEVSVRLTSGAEIYPHRPDLFGLPFWKCDGCMNYVGCHHKTEDRTRPLGNIPTPEIRKARQHIHRILDPLWKGGPMKRGTVYRRLAKAMGRDEYHTAEIRTVEEARDAYRAVQMIAKKTSASESDEGASPQ